MLRPTVCLLAASGLFFGLARPNPVDDELRATSTKQLQDGNFQEAYDGFRKLVMEGLLKDPQTDSDLEAAVTCLHKLGRIPEVDNLLEEAVQRHSDDWRVLGQAARILTRQPAYGMIVAGKFHRGPQRARGGTYASAAARDRVRALQLFTQAIQLARDNATKQERAALYLDLGERVFRGIPAWKLQAKTDLTTLPDYDRVQRFYRGGQQAPGAPVNEQGEPVLHAIPASWEAASSDGERWRWCLQQEATLDESRAPAGQLRYARFLHSQFGVQTLGYAFQQRARERPTDGPWNVHTLSDDETIARLAIGPQRFTLPEQANFVRLFRSLANGRSSSAPAAADQLASIYLNRRQYPAAAKVLTDALNRFGKSDRRRDLLNQIVGHWARFENARVHAAGKGATVDLRFRNATEVQFEAKKINVSKLLNDVRTYLSSGPQRLDSRKINVGNIGYRLVRDNETQYVGSKVAAWNMKLTPPKNHVDDVVTVTTPLQEAGAYLLTAKIPDGNTSRIIVWLTDTAIVRKMIDGKVLFYVAGADDGRPVAGSRLQFFGYRQQRVARNQYAVDVKRAAAKTNVDGLTTVDAATLPRDYTWLTTCEPPSGGLALLGFQRVWYGSRNSFLYNVNKVYTVTDRPVYRPGQTVRYRIWVRNPRFTGKGRSFANMQFELKLMNGRGAEISKANVTTDEFGSVSGEFDLAKDAGLGRYTIRFGNQTVAGTGSFKVEEYKKPEYEVTVSAPSQPVALGEKAKVGINARYYFGSPVTNAQVRYKVTRTAVSQQWYPIGPWDWLYGRGYGWFCVQRDWYPGSVRWRCLPPWPWWFGAPETPPEVVLDREVPIGADGTVNFEIDTAVAKALHDDQDHRYTITAEVVDRSRRTIVGDGTVLVSREPFDVTVWTNRGHYKAGDRIDVQLRAGSLDGTPVSGTAEVRLLKITYDAKSQPVETEVAAETVNLDDTGRGQHRFRAAETGQYRIAVTVTDDKQRKVDGGQLLMVLGGNENGADFRFNDLELIADKRHYKPGDTAELLINTNRTNSTVLLFPRSENGMTSMPRVVRMRGKSTVETVTIAAKDMPNMFVEALTIANGRVHSELRELLVPPESRVVNIEVKPGSDNYRPGEEAGLELTLTDAAGQPVDTPTVVSVYDKSVEYISGGSAIPDIREFFWKIRRRHSINMQTNLNRRFNNLLRRSEKTLQQLGVFGSDTTLLSISGNSRQRGLADRGKAAPGEGAVPASAAAMPAAPATVAPTVRSQFADTAFWSAAVRPDKDGTARVSFKLPDDLTTWKVRTWSVGRDAEVGEAEAEFVTRKNLIVRMQAPRFFTERDQVVLSANVHNYLDSAKSVEVRLELEGSELVVDGASSRTIEVPADGEVRVDWTATVARPGTARIRMLALTNEESDAVERTFPVLVHGMLKTESWTGSIGRTASTGTFDVTVPANRRPDATELIIRYSPSLAGAMVDALPYLVDGPHRTTDATLYRFLPSVIVQRTLQRTGVNLEDVRNKRANLNAQQLGDPATRAAQWKRYDRNPVFSNDEVTGIVKENLQAVVEMQLTDGGWGWFSGYGERSTPHMTAIIVHGLQVAAANDVAIPDGVIDRGTAWLKRYEEEQLRRIDNWIKKKRNQPRKQYADNMDAFVFMVLTNAGVSDKSMRQYLYRDRTHLSACSKAMFGLALHKLGDRDQLAMILRNLSQFVQTDDENESAWLQLPEHGWWYWYSNDIETHAWYLKLLARTNPRGTTTARLARYIVNNRHQATWWSSIRDTAIAIESLAEFVLASGEFNPNLSLEVVVDGRVRKQLKIDRTNLFSFEDRVRLSGEQLSAGRHTVELKKTGESPLYYSAYLTNFTKEDAITAAGLELKVQRTFYRLIKEDRTDDAVGSRGQALKQRGQKFRRERIANFAEVTSGDLVEVELLIESKNDYDYIVLEDPKPAGFEAVDQTSGYTGNGLRAYVEMRDTRVVMYVGELPRGQHSVTYRVRAEIPGAFSAMPTKAYGLYAPELKANSHEARIEVTDSR